MAYTPPITAVVDSMLPLGYGGLISAPAYPGIKPLVSYVIPAGKTVRVLGYAVKMAALTTNMVLYRQTVLWSYAAAVATPAAPTGVNRTITGSGLTPLATYRYKIVAVNSRGKTLPSVELVSTLTTTQNAVALTMVLPAGALYLEIYRTIANGVANSQVYLGATESTTYVDTAPDLLLGAGSPPGSNTTAGSVAVGTFAAGAGAFSVTSSTKAAITTATAVDVIYKTVYGDQRYLTFTPATAIGGQTELQWSGKSNPPGDNRILRLTPGQEYNDVGIQQILAVGNLPATGAFDVVGRTIVVTDQSTVVNSWKEVLFSVPIEFLEGSELVLGITATAAAVAARSDVVLFATIS